LFSNISESEFVGKKPPEDIIVNARFRELKLLIDNKFKVIKITKVRPE
tara:strand:- start:336 stop:479 length:144 start_codon:yes stop_codon:yes gene_type:complete